MDEPQVLSESAALESINAASVATEAAQKASEAQMLAVITKAFEATFNITDSNGQKRFLDVTRVPLICQSIIGIDETLKEIKANMVTKEAFWPVKTLVYGFVGLCLSAMIFALLALIIKS